MVYSFSGTPYGGGPDGANPYAGLVFDAAGNLYGTTLFGGPMAGGTVFRLSPNSDGSWTERILYAFQGGNDATNATAEWFLIWPAIYMAPR